MSYIGSKTKHEHISLHQDSLNTVRIHLEALKILGFSEKIGANGNVWEFMQLSDNGRKIVMELVALRSGAPP